MFVDQLIQYIADWIRYFFENMIAWLTSTFGGVIDWISTYFGQLFSYFDQTFAYVSNSITAWIGQITDSIGGLLTALETSFLSFWDRLMNSTVGVFDEIRAFISGIYSQLQVIISNIVNSINGWISSAAQSITNIVNNAISSIAAIADATVQSITSAIQYTLDKIESLFDSSVGRIHDAYDLLLVGAESLVDTIGQRLSDLRGSFGEAAANIVAGMSDTAETTFGGIRASVEHTFTELSKWAEPGEVSTMMAQLESFLRGKPNPDEMRNFASIEWRRFVPTSGIWTGIFFTIIGLAAAIPLLTRITSTQADIYMQEFSKAYPHALLSPADITAAWRRGFVTEETAVDTIRRQGYTQENADTILHLSEAVPAEADMFLMFHRGILTEARIDEALHHRGFSPEWIANLKEASYLIPPVQDLITMAVREAFSPEIAERFGQYEGFPEDVATWGKKLGLTEEWSQRYWAAHWSLPSPLQGFEMLHRGVVEQDDLDLLLRALDVMPFWRDKLTAIAFRPFTRVDVRRMHKMGVLNDEQVTRAYRDLGYDSEKAAKMTEFTIRYNAPKTADDEGELSELSRTSILGFYGDGLLDRGKAVELLINLGYSQDGAHLYLDSVDFDAERRERKAEVNLILALAEAGAITFEAAEDRLRNAGLTTAEVSKAIVDLVRKRQAKTKLPTRGEAERMVKESVISEVEYKDLLDIMGYSEKWQNAYVALLRKA